MLRKVERSSPALTKEAPYLLEIKIFRLISVLFPPVISALLLVLSLPTFDMGWLAWFGLVPLLIAISGRSQAYGFFSFFIYGFLFFSGIGSSSSFPRRSFPCSPRLKHPPAYTPCWVPCAMGLPWGRSKLSV